VAKVAKIYEDRFMARKSSFMNFESIVLSLDLCRPWGSILCAFRGSLRSSGAKFMAYRLTGSAGSPSGQDREDKEVSRSPRTAGCAHNAVACDYNDHGGAELALIRRKQSRGGKARAVEVNDRFVVET